jgi:pimeloyl-ACP methyl ester carboxylesterase
MNDLCPQRAGFLETDCLKIHWELFGNGDREAICLCNGLAMHTQAWYGFLPRLHPDFDVLLFDYPGQGQSSSEDVPYSIPDTGRYLNGILEYLGLRRIHLMGISYGGFVAMDFARQFQEKLLTLTLSGILLSHEELFQMYEKMSLMFYASGNLDLYTYYLYEKIFGETFVRKIGAQLEDMRKRFVERYKNRIHCLIRLTEAQDPFFDRLDANLADYGGVRTPVLILTGAEDRVIPPWVQKKLTGIFPNTRHEIVEDSGHVVYLEKPDTFFDMLRRFMAARALEF